MENLSYIGLSQQLAVQQQMNMTANNIANMSTPGYKSQHALFNQYLNRPTDKGGISAVENAASYRNMSAGSLTQTHNPLDFAISGDGYFVVQTPQGPRYTRDGSFSMNRDREIVDKSGNRVMGDGGPIAIPAEATDIKISADGSISTKEGILGRFKVVNVDHAQMMSRGGDNLLSLQDGARERPIDDVRVVQGALEGSNVNPVLEMNKMIELLRMFQATQKILQNDHERIRSTIEKLTKV